MRDEQGRLIHPCAVEGCDRLGRGKHCAVHAMRLRLHGDVGPAEIRRRIPSNTPPADRIDIIGWTVDDEGCWIWNGRVDEYGYGRVDPRHVGEGSRPSVGQAADHRGGVMRFVQEAVDIRPEKAE